MKPLVTIIVLNWNGWQDTLECLESLYQIQYPNYKVILVDNHSQDQSLTKIREYCQGQKPIKSPFFTYQNKNKPIPIKEITYQETENRKSFQNDNKTQENTFNSDPKNIRTENQDESPANLILIKNDANYGFAKGNNIAIDYTLKNHHPDYILLLNNDTVVDPDFLTKLVQKAEADARIGIIGPLIYYYDWEGRTDVVANLGGKVNLSKYPGYYDLMETNNLKDFSGDMIECDWVSGAAMLLKVKELPLKFLDEELFFGCEDIDLALNLKKYDYKSVIVLNSHIWHKEGVSRKKRSSEGVKRALMEIKSNLTFIKAHKNHYYLYLPLYLLQIVVLYLKVIMKS
ncbi:MAG: glycosyltransferase family 2 protein [Methanobacterium sp.]|nr:glycosyltransferase family 2 protein [Methanobacterium sp.]